MGQTPDRFPGPLIEEELQLEESAVEPTVEGAIRNVGGVIKMRDAAGVFDPRTGGFAVDDLLASDTGNVLVGGGAVIVKG